MKVTVKQKAQQQIEYSTGPVTEKGEEMHNFILFPLNSLLCPRPHFQFPF